MKEKRMDFATWCSEFRDFLRFHKKYEGPINEAAMERDYDRGLQPEEAADIYA